MSHLYMYDDLPLYMYEKISAPLYLYDKSCYYA